MAYHYDVLPALGSNDCDTVPAHNDQVRAWLQDLYVEHEGAVKEQHNVVLCAKGKLSLTREGWFADQRCYSGAPSAV